MRLLQHLLAYGEESPPRLPSRLILGDAGDPFWYRNDSHGVPPVVSVCLRALSVLTFAGEEASRAFDATAASSSSFSSSSSSPFSSSSNPEVPWKSWKIGSLTRSLCHCIYYIRLHEELLPKDVNARQRVIESLSPDGGVLVTPHYEYSDIFGWGEDSAFKDMVVRLKDSYIVMTAEMREEGLGDAECTAVEEEALLLNLVCLYGYEADRRRDHLRQTSLAKQMAGRWYRKDGMSRWKSSIEEIRLWKRKELLARQHWSHLRVSSAMNEMEIIGKWLSRKKKADARGRWLLRVFGFRRWRQAMRYSHQGNDPEPWRNIKVGHDPWDDYLSRLDKNPNPNPNPNLNPNPNPNCVFLG